MRPVNVVASLLYIVWVQLALPRLSWLSFSLSCSQLHLPATQHRIV